MFTWTAAIVVGNSDWITSPRNDTTWADIFFQYPPIFNNSVRNLSQQRAYDGIISFVPFKTSLMVVISTSGISE